MSSFGCGFRVLAVFALAMTLCCPAAIADGVARGNSNGFPVFGEGRVAAVLVVPEKMPELLEAAVSEFRQRVAEMGGGKVAVHTSENQVPEGLRKILLESADFPSSILFPPGSDERFEIRVEPGLLRLLASEPLGWEFGLYTLLDEYGGVRWFWPGEDGVVVPKKENWIIPVGSRMFEPAYVSRRFSGMGGEGAAQWLRRNRVNNTLSFSHNLRRIFDREFFLENPETLAVEWDPENPPRPGHPIWRSQPDLTSDLVVEAAANAAITAFRANPSLMSFSLGTNDNNRYGNSEGIREFTRPMKYFRGLPDYSDLIFQFMNRVAEIVEKEFPDRFLGCLSYMWAENVPSFPVHPMVLPYLTADRSQGYDVKFTEEDRNLVKRWSRAGPKLIGVWDYLHSARHFYPRRANLIIGQRVRDLWQSGVRAYTAEINPVWPFHGEVPWMVARMLWDPLLKPGELEREFQKAFFGPAADPVGAFYKEAWRVWMFQGGDAEWIKFFQNEDGIELFSEESLDRMTESLETAVELAGNGVYGKRVNALCDAWELTLAAAEQQRQRRKLVLQAEPSVDEVIAFWEARAEFRTLMNQLSGDPWTRNVRWGRFLQSDPSYQSIRSLFEREPDQSDRNAAILIAAAKELEDREAYFQLYWARFLDRSVSEPITGRGALVDRIGEIRKTGVEPWEMEIQSPWELAIGSSESLKVGYTTGEGRDLMITDAYLIGVYRNFPVTPGEYFEATVHLEAKVALGNRSSVEFRWWAEDDELLGAGVPVRIPSGADPVECSVTILGVAPERAIRGGVAILAVRQAAEDFLRIKDVEVRSFGIP